MPTDRKVQPTEMTFRHGFRNIFQPSEAGKEMALSSDQRNTTACLADKLPAELILQISRTLDGSDLLSCSATCRRFRVVLVGEERMRAAISKNDQKVFLKKLDVDRYILVTAPAEMKKKKEWPPLKSKLLCHSCLTTHPTEAFSAAEKKASALTRQCISSTRKFRLCHHQTLTRANLLATFNTSTNPAANRLCNATISSPTISHWSSAEHIMPFTGTTWAHIERHLTNIDRHICPHLRTSNASLQARLRKNAFESKHNWRFGYKNQQGDPFADTLALPRAEAYCRDRYCCTKVLISRLVAATSQLYVRVSRELGHLDDVMDRTWWAQLERE